MEASLMEASCLIINIFIAQLLLYCFQKQIQNFLICEGAGNTSFFSKAGQQDQFLGARRSDGAGHREQRLPLCPDQHCLVLL